MADEMIIPDEAIARLSGLEQLLSIVEGRLPSPTMARTLSFRLVAATPGSATFEGEPGSAVLNPMGTVHGGWAASILDSALGCAVHSTLAIAERYTTLELKVNLVRAILPHSGRYIAKGTVLSRGRRTATSEARLEDAAGKLCAHGTTTCLILPAG